MFVIFGWGFTTRHLFGAVFPVSCPNCHNEELWILQRLRRWFSLFFIPVFPYESTHVLTCPVCGVGRELKGVELKRAKLYAEANSAFQAGALDEDAYVERLAAISGASDDQVAKGIGHVTAVPAKTPALPSDSNASAPVPPPAPPPSAQQHPAPPAPPAPPAGHDVESLRERLFCVGCGNEFELESDKYCPRCGSARPASVASAG